MLQRGIDAVFDGSYTLSGLKNGEKGFNKVYNRGFCDGYYLGQTLGNGTTIMVRRLTRRKIYVG
jgi:putative protease